MHSKCIEHVHRNAMNNILTTDEYWYGLFVHGNVVMGMRNVVMVFANMGKEVGKWESVHVSAV